MKVDNGTQKFEKQDRYAHVQNRKLALNVGCGKDIKESTKEIKWVNLDQHFNNGADMIYELPQMMVVPDGKKGFELKVRGTQLPYADNSVDIIYCSHVIEDFTNEFEPIINEFSRALKPGGLLHIRVPAGLSYGSYHHLRFFSLDTLRGFAYENYQYKDNFKFDIKLCRSNRYGIVSCFILLLLKFTDQSLQRKFWCEYGKCDKEKPNNLKKWIDTLHKFDPKIGIKFEHEVIFVKR